MDGSSLEHSDSDSGESWTLLENTPSYAEDALDGTTGPCIIEGFAAADSAEKDEDTDGISIISDSEGESPSSPELSPDSSQSRPSSGTTPPSFSAEPPISPNTRTLHESIRDDDKRTHHESIRDEDFLGDNTGKLKTYVHRRNKRLSTMLNIIVLGSVITAAGVAIGHMWGARHDCLHPPSAVNKVLSNLYKLQEENAFLRNKLRELTAIGVPLLTRANLPPHKHKCKKLFEESLTSKNVDKLTKCVDNEAGERPTSYLTQPDFEKEFLHDIDKLKHVYQQNKSWLDEEIAKRLRQEAANINDMKNKLKSLKSVKLNEDVRSRKDENMKKDLVPESVSTETVIVVTEPAVQPLPRDVEGDPEPIKVTYADLLKSNHKVIKRDLNDANLETPEANIKKRKPPKEHDTISENSLSEEITKDDRYVMPKYKPERKKNDRQKGYKKQKRRNKYEQWEMKGGYLKDFDDFSVPSVAENEYIAKNDKNPNREFERKNYMEQFSDVEKEPPQKRGEKKRDDNNETVKREGKDEVNWYEKRAALRSEARKRLELELFGENSGAQWYFRRARRRQHCRAKQNQTRRPSVEPTRRKPTLNNYKTKH